MVPLVFGVMIGFEPGTCGIAGFSIRGVVLTVDWGGDGGPKVSTKSLGSLVIDGMGGVGPTKDIGGTNANGIKNGRNEFMIKGFYGGMKPSVKKSSLKLESWDVQTDYVLDLED